MDEESKMALSGLLGMITALLLLVFAFWCAPAKAEVVASPPIPESRWHYHVLPPELIPEVCAAFSDQRNHPGIPLACMFKNLITNECHIFIAPGIPGALFAINYEEKRCRGEEK